MEMEKFYVAPDVEILEVEVEKGFAASPGNESDPNFGGGNEEVS
ncbi:hypothetical protein [Bacteroides ndongoniae]|nr:hypothetical protein [Bacteroides ndongoniae]